VEGLAAVLSLQLPDGLDYRDVMLRAHRELSAVALDAVSELSARRPLPRATHPASLQAPDWDEIKKLAAAVARTASRSEAIPSAFASAEDPSTRRWSRLKVGSATLVASDLAALVRAAVGHCRQTRKPLSLMLLAVDGYADLVFSQGLDTTESILRLLHQHCLDIDRHGVAVHRIADDRLACILPAVDRAEVTRIAGDLVRSFSQLSSRVTRDGSSTATVSAGIASVDVPFKGLSEEDLLTPAKRCLEAAIRSGGNQVKTITVL
jgi:GGDEF domain-containing protein